MWALGAGYGTGLGTFCLYPQYPPPPKKSILLLPMVFFSLPEDVVLDKEWVTVGLEYKVLHEGLRDVVISLNKGRSKGQIFLTGSVLWTRSNWDRIWTLKLSKILSGLTQKQSACFYLFHIYFSFVADPDPSGSKFSSRIRIIKKRTYNSISNMKTSQGFTSVLFKGEHIRVPKIKQKHVCMFLSLSLKLFSYVQHEMKAKIS